MSHSKRIAPSKIIATPSKDDNKLEFKKSSFWILCYSQNDKYMIHIIT